METDWRIEKCARRSPYGHPLQRTAPKATRQWYKSIWWVFRASWGVFSNWTKPAITAFQFKTAKSLLLAVVLAGVLTTAVTLPIATAQTTPAPADPAQPAPAGGGIIQASIFHNIVADGYTTVIASYNLEIDTWCETLIRNQNCPNTLRYTGVAPGRAGIFYADDCQSTNCQDDITVYQRLTRIGPGIIGINFPTADYDPTASGAVCLVMLDQPHGCKLLQQNINDISEEVQTIAFRGWLETFINNFAIFSGLDSTVLLSGTDQFALSAAGVLYINEAIPNFTTKFPELIGGTIMPLISESVDLSPPDVDGVLPGYLINQNQELRTSFQNFGRYFGVEDVELTVLVAATVISLVAAVVIYLKFNGWIAVLAASGIYTIAMLIAPTLFTGLVAVGVIIAFSLIAKLQRYGITN